VDISNIVTESVIVLVDLYTSVDNNKVQINAAKTIFMLFVVIKCL